MVIDNANARMKSQLTVGAAQQLAAKNMISTMSAMTAGGDGDENKFAGFGLKHLYGLYDFACNKLQWRPDSGSRAPGIDSDKFVALLTEFFNTNGGSQADTISGEHAPMIIIGDPAEREATIAAREATMIALFEKIDQLYQTGRLDIRDLFGQLARSASRASEPRAGILRPRSHSQSTSSAVTTGVCAAKKNRTHSVQVGQRTAGDVWGREAQVLFQAAHSSCEETEMH